MAEDGRGAMFEGIVFTVIPSDTLDDPDRVRIHLWKSQAQANLS